MALFFRHVMAGLIYRDTNYYKFQDGVLYPRGMCPLQKTAASCTKNEKEYNK